MYQFQPRKGGFHALGLIWSGVNRTFLGEGSLLSNQAVKKGMRNLQT